MSNTDEERRKLEKPTTTAEQAALLASSLYNVPPNAPLKPLDSYDDRNFYVPPSNNSEPFLLKVHNGVESDNTSILQAQDEIMKYLAKEGFNCSQPIASIHGRTIEYTTTSQRRFAVRALKWVNGKTFNSFPPTPERLLLSGRFLGKLRGKLDRFDHPGCHRDHLWDIRQTSGLRLFLHALNDVPEIQQVCTNVVDEFEKIQDQLNALKWGTLQADFNDANIIFNDLGDQVVGLIDFGDIVYSNRINDLAIAMAYMTLRPPVGFTTVQTAATFLQGYCQTMDIAQKELNMLRILVACRLACSVTLGAYSSMQDKSDNEYLQLHAAPGRKALLAFWNVDEQEVYLLFQKAADEGLKCRLRETKVRQIIVGGTVGFVLISSFLKGLLG